MSISTHDYERLLADLAELCRLTGEYDGARHESPHAVFQDCLSRIREQHAAAERARELLKFAQAPSWDGKDYASPECDARPLPEWVRKMYGNKP